MNWIEAIATVFGIIAVYLNVRRNIWCWPSGLVQVLLYVYIFYGARLYSDMILHVIFSFMQIYGWYSWYYGGEHHDSLPISLLRSRWPWLGGLVVGTAAWGYLRGSFTDAAVPYADAFTTVASLMAMYLMAKKKIESWYFWIVVDLVAIAIYLYKGLYITTGLYAVFLGLSIMGLVEWRREFNGYENSQTSITGA